MNLQPLPFPIFAFVFPFDPLFAAVRPSWASFGADLQVFGFRGNQDSRHLGARSRSRKFGIRRSSSMDISATSRQAGYSIPLDGCGSKFES